MLKLHYAPKTISITCAIAFEELGIAYEPVLVNFAEGAQTKPAYLALNPKGRVPLLETPLGLLTESIAILEYVCDDLIPGEAYQAARMRETLQYLSSTMHVAHAHKMRGHRWATQESSFADMQAKVAENIETCCAYLEDHLDLSPYAIGDTLTLADVYLFMLLSWAPGDGADLGKTPRLLAHFQMMDARPSAQAVREKGML